MADETNPSNSDLERAEKYLNAVSLDTSNVTDRLTASVANFDINGRLRGVPLGAEPTGSPEPSVVFKDINGNKMGRDTRVKIRVPQNYFLGRAAQLTPLGGVVFPYTPTVNFEYKADYASQTPLHSNFAIHFYQRSSIGAINISGKFTVSDSMDARNYLASVHLLRSLTKMRSGGASTGDSDSGAPPPVCRLDAYGDEMLNNVPIVITSVRIDLPDNVDYFTFLDPVNDYMNSVPTVSTISVNCLPMFSRNEMLKFNVNGYMGDSKFRKEGYM
jgi:hypothetical protein